MEWHGMTNPSIACDVTHDVYRTPLTLAERTQTVQVLVLHEQCIALLVLRSPELQHAQGWVTSLMCNTIVHSLHQHRSVSLKTLVFQNFVEYNDLLLQTPDWHCRGCGSSNPAKCNSIKDLDSKLMLNNLVSRIATSLIK